VSGDETDADGTARRVAVTGTPGTGKTSATELLDVPVIHLNDLIREAGLWTDRDADRDSLVADLDAVREAVGDWSGVVESHLAHHLDADRVVVLRCRPDVLADRLRDRGATEAKAAENAESEALDVILSETVDVHGADRVYEVDTTDLPPAEVAAAIEAVIAGERDPSAGEVDFLEYL
jgi:adenylate kinase